MEGWLQRSVPQVYKCQNQNMRADLRSILEVAVGFKQARCHALVDVGDNNRGGVTSLVQTMDVDYTVIMRNPVVLDERPYLFPLI
jgi:hypothetical protein